MTKATTKKVTMALLAGVAIAGFTASQLPAIADWGDHMHHQAWNHVVLQWTGDVDDTAIVHIHGGDVHTDTIHGKDTSNIYANVIGDIPDGPAYVNVDSWTGRGDVRVVEQPTPRNNFTAGIRIYDPQSGRGHYTFTLSWHPFNH